MTTTPPPTTAPPQHALTRRDLQRIALRDLVALATESATTETQIERKYQTAVEGGKKEARRLTWEIDDKLKAAREKVEAEYQEKTSAAQRQSNAELGAARANEAKGRQRFDHDHKAVERDVKTKYDHACWLAESVFDAAQIGLREEMKATKATVEGWNTELDEMEAKARDALILYGHFPPPEVPASTETLPPAEDTKAGFAAAKEAAQSSVTRLATLALPRMLVGAKPIILFILGLAIAAAIVQFRQPDPMVPNGKKIGIACLIAAGIMAVGGIGLKLLANSQVRKNWAPARNRLDLSRTAAEAHLEHEKKVNEQKAKEAAERRAAEEQSAKDKFQPLINQSSDRRKAGLAALLAELNEKTPKIEAARATALAEIEQWRKQKLSDLQSRYERELKGLHERIERHNADTLRQYNEATAALQQRLSDGLANIQAPIEEKSDQKVMDWDDPAWSTWTPPKKFASTIPIGHLTIDLRKIADSVPRKGDLKLQLPEPFKMTASLGFPAQASLLVETDRAGRAQAIETVQMVMARLLTTLPAGRVKFTLIDPVGLGQNFAGFMHLADHDDSLVGGRIWTESEQIEQRLADLTEHMETVIQKYLRNEYETIDEYNAQAGELAEPYRFLVVNDFPTGFQGEAFRRLMSISSSGARCGVYILIIRDTRQPLPSEMHIEDVQAHSVTLEREDDHFVWKDDTFREFPLTLDPPPAEEFLTRTLDVVGRYAKLAKRVEVSFDSIAPKQDDFWTRSTADELTVPVGRMGATRLQELRLGKGVAQHMIIAGKTGSGKSTLLHAIVTNLAMWYSPDEVEFYLVDFKKGVEFKTYATHDLPHARAVAVESDREFGLSVLQRLDAELTRRGELFRKLGLQDLPSYRALQKERGNDPSLPTLPRTLLMIDEFQEFFTEDDKLAQDAALLLDRLVRQGRAFGVHVILGSQTIGGSSGLSRATIGQMAVRVALQTSEADSQLILGDGNSAARLLTRPGEAIYNDAGGLVEANSPFQVAWLNDDRRDDYLDRVTALNKRHAKNTFLPLIVFEGNAPADMLQNRKLSAALASDEFLPAGSPAIAWMGDPVAIKDPAGIAFRRQSGANVIFIGQQDESAQAMMATMMLSLAAQQSPAAAQFYVMDGTPADSPFASTFPRIAETLPHDVKLVEYRAVGDVINDLMAELSRRQAADDPTAPSIYVFVYGLQRYRTLRKGEEDFSFSMSSDEEKKPNPGKQFADLLREGPPHGIHVIAFADTPATVERTFERNTLREFDTRILFQMSANDSSNLIDSPAANKLGFNRALAFSEEQGTLEKFRPYALPPKEWLQRYRERLAAKASPARAG